MILDDLGYTKLFESYYTKILPNGFIGEIYKDNNGWRFRSYLDDEESVLPDFILEPLDEPGILEQDIKTLKQDFKKFKETLK